MCKQRMRKMRKEAVVKAEFQSYDKYFILTFTFIACMRNGNIPKQVDN